MIVVELADQERAWWDEVAAGPDMTGNVYDESIGTAQDCLAEIVPALDLAPDAWVLDLGCGPGRLIRALAREHDGPIVGVDISTRMLDLAAVNKPLNVSYLRCDGRTIPGDERFDAAYSMGLFQHLPAEACAGYVREVARVLRPGGRFRFQSVLGDEDAFLSHQTSMIEMLSWCDTAGLELVASGFSRLKPEWYWITARKPVYFTADGKW